jgi:hypothetical protein
MTILESAAKSLAERGLGIHWRNYDCFSCHKEDDISIDLMLYQGRYCLRCLEDCPGPGEVNFFVTYDDLDEASLAAWNFYFAKPIQIDGWIVPMHRQPYWKLPQLQYRLANAMHVTSSRFQAIREKRVGDCLAAPKLNMQRTGLEDRSEASDRQIFIRNAHASDPSIVLQIRRDMEEAYIVQNDG